MLKTLKTTHSELLSLRKDIRVEQREQISKKDLRKRAEDLGTLWFSEVLPGLKDRYGIASETLDKYSGNFERLIKLSAPNNRRKSYLGALSNVLQNYRDELILPIQRQPFVSRSMVALEEIFSSFLNPDEDLYFKEAMACAKHKLYRGAIVLGWCAAIDRIHRVIQRIGFTTFNTVSIRMAKETKGRYKRFSASQNVNSLSELREVFDNVVLWILEGMQVIDGNQRTRLKACFDLRCQCAHPGDAPVTKFNLLSFFSDLNEIVFKNPKFSV